jgi:hypothetical protein
VGIGHCEDGHLAYSRIVAEHSSKSVGLGGDGDEIAAIDDIERTFGVKLDYADAPNWSTAGDVFRSLRKALPAEELNSPDLWKRFAAALSGQTGVNPNEIDPDSPLLSQSRFWAHVANVSAVVWLAMAASIMVFVAWMIL